MGNDLEALMFVRLGFVPAQGTPCWLLLSPAGCQPCRSKWGTETLPAALPRPLSLFPEQPPAHGGTSCLLVGSQAGGARAVELLV